MKKLVIALSVAAGIGGLGLASLSYAASDNGNAYGKIRQAVINIAADTNNELDFGEVLASGVAGPASVIIDAQTGGDTTTGGVQSGAVSTNFGGFDVTGNRPNATYAVSFPGAPFTLTCVGTCLGADPTIDNFTIYSVNGGLTPALSAGPSPADYLQIGAELSYDPVGNDGDWQGTYVVDVVYN